VNKPAKTSSIMGSGWHGRSTIGNRKGACNASWLVVWLRFACLYGWRCLGHNRTHTQCSPRRRRLAGGDEAVDARQRSVSTFFLVARGRKAPTCSRGLVPPADARSLLHGENVAARMTGQGHTLRLLPGRRRCPCLDECR
jgi:hypothetical protein